MLVLSMLIYDSAISQCGKVGTKHFFGGVMVHFTDSGDVGRISKPGRVFFQEKERKVEKDEDEDESMSCEDVFQEWPQFPGVLYHFPIFFIKFPYFPIFFTAVSFQTIPFW